MGGTAQTRQIGSPNIALKQMFVAAGRTHLIRKRTGRSMTILCRDVMLINQITIIIDYLLF